MWALSETCTITTVTKKLVDGSEQKYEVVSLNDNVLQELSAEVDIEVVLGNDTAKYAEFISQSKDGRPQSAKDSKFKSITSFNLKKTIEPEMEKPKLIIHTLLDALVNKYIHDSQALDKFHTLQKEIAFSDSTQPIDSVLIEQDTTDHLFSYEQLLSSITNILTSYPECSDLLVRYKNKKISKDYSIVDFITKCVFTVGQMRYLSKPSPEDDGP